LTYLFGLDEEESVGGADAHAQLAPCAVQR